MKSELMDHEKGHGGTLNMLIYLISIIKVRELAFDKGSKPKDRTKTEEELALEEKEALEKVERTRMLGRNETDYLHLYYKTGLPG